MAGAEMESAAGRVPEEWEALMAEEADMVGLGREPLVGETAAGGERTGAGGREKKKPNSLIPCRKEKITTHPMWVGSLSYISPIRHTWKVQIQEARLYIVTSLSMVSL